MNQHHDPAREVSLRRLYELMHRVNSSTDTTQVLEEITRGVTEGLGYGVAAISRLDGDTLVLTAFAGPETDRPFVLGRRIPVQLILDEYAQGDSWGILRYIPHGRVSEEFLNVAWIPDYEPIDAPDAWHPEDALYAPLYSATGELLGNMSVDLPPGGRIPDQQQRELLEMFVVQAGLALSNAQHRSRLAEQVRLGEMLKKVAMAGNLYGLDNTLDAAVRAVGGGLDAPQSWVRCFADGAGDATEHAAGHPAPNPIGQAIPTLRGDLVRMVEHGRLGPVTLEVDEPGSDWLPESRPLLQARMVEHDAVVSAVAPLRVGVEVLGYVVVMRAGDQPELTEAELAALAEVGRQLGQTVLSARLRVTEQRLIAELQQLDRYKGELIATISHELKTPLTSIVGHTELLSDGGDLDRSVDAITRNARRLQDLIDNLLSYSRLEEQRELAARPVDLAELAGRSLETLGVQAERAGVLLHLQVQEDVEVVGDPEGLGRVLDNICSNAVKYSRRGNRVVVIVGRDGDRAWVSVCDEGLGISGQDQAHLFSAFHRSSNPEALSIPGTGLGLAISRRIVDLHGGEIEVESAIGAGSTFTVRLPVSQVPSLSA